MPKIKPFEGRIPAFYRRSALDLMMFAHVNAVRHHKDLSLVDAIIDFLDYYGIDSYEYNIETVEVAYQRIRNNFIYAHQIEPIKKNLKTKKK